MNEPFKVPPRWHFAMWSGLAAAFAVMTFVSVGMTCGGCNTYCAQPAHKTEVRCQVQTIATKCGEPAIFKLVMQVLPEVVGDLVSGNYSDLLSHLISTLEQQGIADAATVVTCAVQQADVGTTPRGAATNPNLVTVKTHAQLWLATRKLLGPAVSQ